MKKIKGCIYKLTNLATLDAYCGQHANVETVEHVRWARHIKTARLGHGNYLHAAIAAYDFEFSAEVIWIGPIEQLDTKEAYYIKKFHTFVGDPKYKGGYNLTAGGQGSRGMHHSAETKAKLKDLATAQYSMLSVDGKRQVRNQLIAANSAHWARNDARAVMSSRLVAQWQDEAYAEKMAVSRKITYETSKPSLLAGVAAYWTDANKARQAARLAKRYKSKAERDKTGVRSRAAWGRLTPEQRHARAMKGVATRRAKCLSS